MGEGNPFLATVGLRVEPGPVGSGVEFRLEVELGSMPYAFFRAVEDTVRATLAQGLHGWQVADCVVTMTHSGYCAAAEPRARRASTRACPARAGDFRGLTPLVLMDALRRAGTRVQEPIAPVPAGGAGRHDRAGDRGAGACIGRCRWRPLWTARPAC